MSIYNTSRTDKSKVRAPVRRGGGPLRPGMGPQRLMEQQRAQQQMQQPQEELTFNEFQLMSTSKRGQNHLMDFKSSKRVEPNKFARPVKLHRKETNFIPYRQYIQNLNAQNAANAAAAAAAAAKAAAIMAGTTIPNDTSTAKVNKNVEDLGNEISPDGPQVTPQPQHGPKTGADTSLIAPLGGATRNKQMLFKKRTKQIYLAKEDTRELKEQEHRPWILEDYDSHNSFNGTLEGGQRSDYMFFVLSDNGFKVMPVDRWYKFQPKRNFKTLTLEEAEEQLKKQQKRENGRWMMLKRENEQAESAEAVRPNKFKIVDTDETAKAGSDDEGNNRQDSDIDDLDFDDVFQDDDEATAEHEVEDEDVKDSKDRVKKEIKDFAIGGQEVDDEYDEMGKLTSEGKQMRKLVRDLEKNRAYESDDDVDPYASSAEELDSDANDEDGEEDNENKEKEKKNAAALKKKAVAPPSKPVMPKKAHTAKIKKEGMSKPIGRPGSPSLYINKRESSPASGRAASPVRPSSPLKEARPSSPLNSSSPSRPAHRASPTPSSPPKEQSKKRKMKDAAIVNNLDVKHRKTGKSSSDLITEQEVIDTLRGHPMTTQDFLMNFRKRIKSNTDNRAIITDLLRKVARRNNSADPSTRMLELKPEFQ